MLASASVAAFRPHQLRSDRCSLPARPAASVPRGKAHSLSTVRAMASITRHEVGARMSEASVYNGIIHLAGQVADDAEQDVTGQTTQVLAAVDRLLALAGSDKTRILMTQIYLKDIKDFPSMNAVWDKWVVAGNTPPRATVQASLANDKWLIEVVVTAAAK